MPVEVFIHKMTDHMESGRIIQWLVKEGDHVQQRQPIMEVETDKAVAELESPANGILKGIRTGAQPGAEIPVGETIAFIAESDEQVPVLPPLSAAKTQTDSNAATLRPASQSELVRSQVRSSPAVRRIARELGIDINLVTGTGPEGKITEADVRSFSAKGALSPSANATLNASLPDPADWMELNSVQRLTGERMLQSVRNAPQFALTASAEMTNLLRLRDEIVNETTKERLSVTVFFVKVVATALKVQRRANASFEAGRVKVHRRINVGVAIGTETGLIVPVIKDADQKNITEIARELQIFREKALQMRFNTNDLTGGTFTISNLGMYGIDQFNAIINPQESAILAVGRVIKSPFVLPDDTIAIRPIVNLTLTVDHRVMDGILGAKLLAAIKERLENPDWIRNSN